MQLFSSSNPTHLVLPSVMFWCGEELSVKLCGEFDFVKCGGVIFKTFRGSISCWVLAE